MSITDLIMVFEVHIKMQVHPFLIKRNLNPCVWCTLQITNMHIACTKHTITLYICMCALQEKKHVNKDFTVTVVVHWQSCLPEIFCHGQWGGGRSQIEQIQEICRGQGSEWWQNLIANTVMANSLWKKKLKYLHLKCYNDVIQKYCYTVHISF